MKDFEKYKSTLDNIEFVEKKKSTLSDTSFSQLIDMSKQDFDNWLESKKLTLGETKTLYNFLSLTWFQSNDIKDALMTKHQKPETTEEEKENIIATVKDILLKMMSLEYKVCRLKEREVELSGKLV